MKRIYNSLFWRLSLFFLVSLLAFASINVYITYNSSLQYSQETSQKLNRSLAARVAKHTTPFIKGNLNEGEVKEIFHDVMVINPSVEVYLLNNNGKILSFYAPFGEVKLKTLDLEPIQSFIANEDEFIKGEDPRNPGTFKVFSAAPIENEGKQVGFVYVILASEEYTTILDMLSNSFIMKLATNSITISLVSTLIIGLIIIWFLTKNLNHIMSKVTEFQNGKLDARINLQSRGELSTLANNIDSMADTIVENINELKSVETLRKELIANVSHDLRTPLTSIQGYAETLVMMNDTLDEEAKLKYANTILNSTEKVKKQVDELFEIAKLESNHIQTKKELFPIGQMLSDVVSKFDLLAKSQNVPLKLEMDDPNLQVFADLSLIDRVFQNLLDNALKHTKEGETITIMVKSKRKGFVEITIQDTGVGIPDAELPYIFDRYRKIKGNTKEGTGLGLAIVKKIMELHNTDISVRSVINQGTTFNFELPMS